MRVSDASYMSGKFSLCQVCACSVALLTLEHGLCPASSYALASLGGGTVQYFQDYATSRHLSEMALFVQKRIGNGKEVGSQYAAYQFGLLWTTPFFHNRDVFYTVYLSGVRAGESDFSMWSLFSHLLLVPWMLGTPIDQMLEDSSTLVVQLAQVSQHLILEAAKCFQQMLLNMSVSECLDRTQLQGTFFTVIILWGRGTFLPIIFIWRNIG